MDKDMIIVLLMGFLAIGVAVFGKFRPDIIFRNAKGEVLKPENQRFMFFYLVLFGIMVMLIAVVSCFPQWQDYYSAIGISIALVLTIVMLFGLWWMVLRHNERFCRIAFVAISLISLALVALGVYYWCVALK